MKFMLHVAFAALAGLGGFAAQAKYPDHPVRVIIPFPPGGTLDLLGRELAQKLGQQTGQSFIIENRAGGNGVIGADVVTQSKPDGYTLLFNASTFITAPMTMKSPPYNVQKNFTPIAMVAKAPLAVSVNKNLPVTDIAGLLAYSKSHPGMTFAVGSIGSAGHLGTELLKREGGLNYMVVPYKGTAPAFQDLIGGQIDGFIDPVLGALESYKSGLLKILAVTSDKRLPNLPEVPTVAETLPGYQAYSWYGLWGPADVPAAVVAKLNAQVNTALAALEPKYAALGLLLTPGSVADFVKFQREDMARSRKLIEEGHIRVQ
nr:tripartite tricarboxylate transporter substrate binding protein [Bordetella sp. FB-8]